MLSSDAVILNAVKELATRNVSICLRSRADSSLRSE